MRYTTGIVVAAIFVVAVTIAVFHGIGQPGWAAWAWGVLFGLAAVLAIVRIARRAPVGGPIAESGQVPSDIMMGVTYAGPRTSSPPVQQDTELVVDLPAGASDPLYGLEPSDGSGSSRSGDRS